MHSLRKPLWHCHSERDDIYADTMLRILFVMLLLGGDFGLAHGQTTASNESIRKTARIEVDKLEGIITGKVIDEATGLGIEFANIAIYKSGTEVMVSGVNSTKNGDFSVKNLPCGEYDVTVIFLGYEENKLQQVPITEGDPKQSIGEIFLTGKPATLGEVKVVSERAIMQFGSDKKVYNIEKDLTSATGSVTEILRNIPSIDVDIEGNVHLRGSENVKILVNGIPSAQIGLDKQRVLQQIPGGMVKEVEVITNPSAKYSTEGISGIINIITKKQNKRGFHSSGTFSYDSNNNLQSTLNFNYRLNKFNFFLNLPTRKDRRVRKGEIFRKNILRDTIYSLNTLMDIDGDRRFLTLTGGMEYYFDARSVLSYSYSHTTKKSLQEGTTFFDYFNHQNLFTGSSSRDDIDNENGNGVQHNINFNKIFKQEGTKLSVIASFSNFNEMEEERFDETFSDEQGIENPFHLLENTFDNDNNLNAFIQADYSQKFHNDLRFDTGIRSSSHSQKNEYGLNTFDYPSGQYLTNDTFSNSFEYEENVLAGYLMLTQQYKKFEFQAGVRGEQTNTLSFLDNTKFSRLKDFPFRNNYFKLFPSGSVTYFLSQNQKFILSYSKRINRPSIQQVIPSVDFSNRFDRRVGNPFLLPEIINAYELGYIKSFEKGTFNTNFFFRNTHDGITRINNFDKKGNPINTYDNLDYAQTFGLELINTFRPYKWWNFNTSLTGYWQEINASNIETGLQIKGLQWNGRLISNFNLTKKTDLQWYVFYQSESITPQGMRLPFYWTDLAIKQNLFKGASSITLKVTDFFNTRQYSYELNTPHTQLNMDFSWPSRGISLGLIWHIGTVDKRKETEAAKKKRKGEFDYETF